jgi:hypothetical protein
VLKMLARRSEERARVEIAVKGRQTSFKCPYFSRIVTSAPRAPACLSAPAVAAGSAFNPATMSRQGRRSRHGAALCEEPAADARRVLAWAWEHQRSDILTIYGIYVTFELQRPLSPVTHSRTRLESGGCVCVASPLGCERRRNQ